MPVAQAISVVIPLLQMNPGDKLGPFAMLTPAAMPNGWVCDIVLANWPAAVGPAQVVLTAFFEESPDGNSWTPIGGGEIGDDLIIGRTSFWTEIPRYEQGAVRVTFTASKLCGISATLAAR